MRPERVGLIAHTAKPGVAELVKSACAAFDRHKIKVVLEEETATLIGSEQGHTVLHIADDADLLVVLGGDGTILNVLSQLHEMIPPIFGINVGKLGFLTTASSGNATEAIDSIAAGQLELCDRTLLDIDFRASTRERLTLRALNEAVFSRGEVSRIIRLKMRVNGEQLTEFNADGVIVATPTGSTAYSLSAGGPILAPESGALVITPICPHVLTNRSIIVGEDAMIEVEASEPAQPIYLTIDGREPRELATGSTTRIHKSKRVLPLASLPGTSFFGVVRQKLKWSGTALE